MIQLNTQTHTELLCILCLWSIFKRWGVKVSFIRLLKFQTSIFCCLGICFGCHLFCFVIFDKNLWYSFCTCTQMQFTLKLQIPKTTFVFFLPCFKSVYFVHRRSISRWRNTLWTSWRTVLSPPRPRRTERRGRRRGRRRRSCERGWTPGRPSFFFSSSFLLLLLSSHPPTKTSSDEWRRAGRQMFCASLLSDGQQWWTEFMATLWD